MKISNKVRGLFLALFMILLSSAASFAYEGVPVIEEETVSGVDPRCHCWDVTIFGVHIVTKCNKYCGDMAGWDWF